MELFLLLFADDLTLISTVIGLQNQLRVLHQSTQKICLKANLDKTKIVVFRKGSNLAMMSLGEETLEVVNKYIYLGLGFSTKLSINSEQ